MIRMNNLINDLINITKNNELEIEIEKYGGLEKVSNDFGRDLLLKELLEKLKKINKRNEILDKLID